MSAGATEARADVEIENRRQTQEQTETGEPGNKGMVLLTCDQSVHLCPHTLECSSDCRTGLGSS